MFFGFDLQGLITVIGGVLLALITLFTGTTMSTSLDVQPSGSISKSEYLSCLPRWRRWLSKLNWHPVVEIEIRAIEREKRMQELEQRSIVREKRMQQIESEISRLAELNAKIDALWPSSNSSSAPTTPPEGDSQI